MPNRKYKRECYRCKKEKEEYDWQNIKDSTYICRSCTKEWIKEREKLIEDLRRLNIGLIERLKKYEGN